MNAANAATAEKPKTQEAAAAEAKADAKKDQKDSAVTTHPPKNKWQALWRNHLRPIGILVLVFTSFRSVVADWNDVPSGSMRPNIIEGDRIFVNKLAYSLKIPYTAKHIAWWGKPGRGDVVIFYKPKEGTRLVKRVVGVPGDRIEVRNDLVIINGQMVGYDPAPSEVRRALPNNEPRDDDIRFLIERLEGRPHPIMINPTKRNAKSSIREFTVKEGWYFMMGDNRNNSEDSRFFDTPENGCVPIESILGRATRTIFSLDYKDYYLPRGDRWFRKLP